MIIRLCRIINQRIKLLFKVWVTSSVKNAFTKYCEFYSNQILLKWQKPKAKNGESRIRSENSISSHKK